MESKHCGQDKRILQCLDSMLAPGFWKKVYYSSTTEELLNKALDFALQFDTITKEESDVIIHANRLFLHSKGATWGKLGKKLTHEPQTFAFKLARIRKHKVNVDLMYFKSD